MYFHYVGFEIGLLCVVTDSERKILRSLSATKPNRPILKAKFSLNYGGWWLKDRDEPQVGADGRDETGKILFLAPRAAAAAVDDVNAGLL